MNFDLRNELRRNRDTDSTFGNPFTKEQEERLRELIRAEVFKILGPELFAPRTRIELDGGHRFTVRDQYGENAITYYP